ncbi:HEAT repeat domain-containing protein [Thalassoroseus pseudoceratinae]|uniref:HEAT repeat domain-containing protein n=1 Tax=Thalassoroseus pseudoceratinae TaxID=2713176 RepID=UPI00142072A0|nr:HEAT repeat domain-containing protein [Thalassoroseus pseudoceratinae]
MSDVSQWIQALSSDDVTTRRSAAKQLAQNGPDAQAAAVPLVRCAGDDDEQVREWAVGALEELGPPPADEISSLEQLATDANSDIAWWSVTLLGRLKNTAAPAVPTLVQVLKTSDATNVQERTVWALDQISIVTEDVLAALEVAAKSPSPRLSRLAIRTQQRLNP